MKEPFNLLLASVLEPDALKEMMVTMTSEGFDSSRVTAFIAGFIHGEAQGLKLDFRPFIQQYNLSDKEEVTLMIHDMFESTMQIVDEVIFAIKEIENNSAEIN